MPGTVGHREIRNAGQIKVELEMPSGAWGLLGATQRLFQTRLGIEVGPSHWRFEALPGEEGLRMLVALVLS